MQMGRWDRERWVGKSLLRLWKSKTLSEQVTNSKRSTLQAEDTHIHTHTPWENISLCLMMVQLSEVGRCVWISWISLLPMLTKAVWWAWCQGRVQTYGPFPLLCSCLVHRSCQCSDSQLSLSLDTGGWNRRAPESRLKPCYQCLRF